jgi:hypothetical protein
MHTVKCKPQCSYQHGENMCSTAAVCMCISMVGKDACGDQRARVDRVMNVASKAHQQVKDRGGNELASVADVVKHLRLDGTKRVDFVEYIICDEGCTETKKTPTGYNEPTSCLISSKLLTQCLESRSGTGDVVAAILTCNGHSVCVSRTNHEYSLFDSGPSFLIVGMDDTEFNQKMNEFIVGGQCDVTVIYPRL